MLSRGRPPIRNESQRQNETVLQNRIRELQRQLEDERRNQRLSREVRRLIFFPGNWLGPSVTTKISLMISGGPNQPTLRSAP